MLEFHRENKMPDHIKDIGIIHDTSVHDIDTANWLFDEMPIVVFAKAGKINHEHEDFASVMLGYKKDKVAIITSNWISPKKVRTFSAICTNATMTSDFISQKIKIVREKESEVIQIEKESLLLEIKNFLDRRLLRLKDNFEIIFRKSAYFRYYGTFSFLEF